MDWGSLVGTGNVAIGCGNNNLYLLSNTNAAGTGGVVIGQNAGNVNARLSIIGRTGDPNGAGTGTAAITTGSNIVTGTGTNFLNKIGNGYCIKVGTYTYSIKSTDSDTQLTLYSNALETTSGVAYIYYVPVSAQANSSQANFFAVDELGNFISKGVSPQIILNRTSGKCWGLNILTTNNGALNFYNQTNNTVPFYIDGSAPASSAFLDASGNYNQLDGTNFVLGTTTGSKIGTATGQKLGFWNATPVVQGTGWTAFANAPTALKTLDANSYTLDEVMRIVYTVVEELKTKGLIAA
jgi:hypothetical protein